MVCWMNEYDRKILIMDRPTDGLDRLDDRKDSIEMFERTKGSKRTYCRKAKNQTSKAKKTSRGKTAKKSRK